MKKLALIAAAAAGAATLAPQQASAQVFVHPGFHHGGFGHGNFFGGFAFGGFFHQPQFHVQNWQLYGFIAPQAGQRWVRYYDDAYLVDRRGYVHDRRQRVDWDRYGERWGRDSYGIPHYVGDGDYHPDGRDYERVERGSRYGSDWDYSGYGSSCGRPQSCDGDGRGDHRTYERHRRDDGHRGGRSDRGRHGDATYRGGHGSSGHGERRVVTHRYAPQPMPMPPSCGQPGYDCRGYGYGGYQQGYGYGQGCGYGCNTVIVTETTVTPGVVTEEIIEEVVEERVVRRPHRRRAAPPPRRHHAPRPPRVVQPEGDRG